MANPEMTLMQFVALTLPAVAILMQAMLNYREQYLEEITTVDFNTEFQLLEWGFLFLVFSGILFGAKILFSSDSLLILVGVGFLTASLPILALSILIALRRPLYLDENTSVETEIYNKGIKYSKLFLIPAAAGVGTYAIQEFFSEFVSRSVISVTNIVNQIAIIVTAASVTIGALSLLEQYYRMQRGNKTREKWNHLIKAVSEKTVKIINETSIEAENVVELEERQEKIEQMEEDWETVIGKAPSGVDSSRVKEMEQAKNLLSQYREGVSRIASLKENLNENEKAQEKIRERIDSLENEMEEREDTVGVPGPDDMQHLITKGELKEARSELTQVEYEVDKISSELGELEERTEELEEELLQQAKKLNNTFQELIS